LQIGEKNSQSSLHNEKIQLMIRPPLSHDRIEPWKSRGFMENSQGAEDQPCKYNYYLRYYR
jgi:hypothetical protein